MKARIFLLNILFSLAITMLPAPVKPRAGQPAQATSNVMVETQAQAALRSTGPSSEIENTPTVSMQAASGNRIEFWTQNGRTVGEQAPQLKDIPHLVLFRNGELTAVGERQLRFSLSGLDIPAGGAQVSLKVETQDGDPDQGGGKDRRILVYQSSQLLSEAGKDEQPEGIEFFLEFSGTIKGDGDEVHTPTGYYRCEILVSDLARPEAEPIYRFEIEYAFLLESQWIEHLPGVLEVAPGAAPDELVIYYQDMTPFQVSASDPGTRQLRAAITGYIQHDLAPALVVAYRQQSVAWGFAWHPAWTGFREGEDSERLTVALSDGRTWFHGMAPSIGYGGISLKVSAGYGEQATYSSLTEKLLGPFHHELFHNHQRNIAQQLAGSGDVDGRQGAWKFFSEGTAVLAASVGQPGLQLSSASGTRDYLFNANSFIQAGLNRSYADLNAYHAALYWRFLYEQCGGLGDGGEQPAAGMQVIRNALEVLYSGEVVDIRESTDLVSALPEVIDRAIAATPACPFGDYRDSLMAFARAIYSLRLAGRENFNGSSFFFGAGADYVAPEAVEVAYRGEELVLEGSLPASYGMDFVEVVVAPGLEGTPEGALAFELITEDAGSARYSTEVWVLEEAGEGAAFPAGSHEANIKGGSRLGLLIARLDSAEDLDPVGAYTIRARPVRAGN